jgi:hypothetical protein
MRSIGVILAVALSAVGLSSLAAAPQLGGIITPASPDSRQGVGLGALRSTSAPAPQGRVTVRAWQSLSADAKRAYALGVVDGALADGGSMTGIILRGFLPCMASLTDDQISEAVTSSIAAVPPDAVETFASRPALRALHAACPAAPR